MIINQMVNIGGYEIPLNEELFCADYIDTQSAINSYIYMFGNTYGLYDKKEKGLTINIYSRESGTTNSFTKEGVVTYSSSEIAKDFSGSTNSKIYNYIIYNIINTVPKNRDVKYQIVMNKSNPRILGRFSGECFINKYVLGNLVSENHLDQSYINANSTNYMTIEAMDAIEEPLIPIEI